MAFHLLAPDSRNLISNAATVTASGYANMNKIKQTVGISNLTGKFWTEKQQLAYKVKDCTDYVIRPVRSGS